MKALLVNLKNTLTDPIKFKKFIRQNKRELTYWAIFCVFLLLAFVFCSDGDFSFFLTLSGAVQMFGFGLVLYGILKTKNVHGISSQTLLCYTISFFFRLASILFFDGYLPLDSSGDYLYRLVELLSFGFSLSVFLLMTYNYKISYDKAFDSVKFYYIVPVAFIFALLFHPSLNEYPPADISWTFALYLESIAIFPQIYLLSQKGGEIENTISNFVASQGFSRILNFVFWIFTYEELNAIDDSESLAIAPKHAGYCVFVAQIIQIVLMADFLYHYLKSVNSGMPMTLPTFSV